MNHTLSAIWHVSHRLKRLLPNSNYNRYQYVENIDLEELAPELSHAPIDIGDREYGIWQSWLTDLMKSIQSADFFDQSDLPCTSKDAHYFAPLAAQVRSLQWLTLLMDRNIVFPLIFSAILDLISCFSTLAAPLILRRLLQNPKEANNFVALFGVSVLATVTGRAKDQICRVLSVRASSLLQLAIFQKSLRFSNLAHLRCPAGKVLGSSTMDMMLIRNYILKVHDIWSSLVQLVLIAVLVFKLLGVSGIAGFVALSTLLFSQTKANSTVGVAVEDYMRLDELRINHLSSAFRKISGIKSLGLEPMFLKEIRGARELQLEALGHRLRLVFCFFTSINQMIPALTALVSFIVFWHTGHELVAETVFPALTLFEMSYSPASKLSLSVTRQFSIQPCLRRISYILKQPEQEPEGFSDLDLGDNAVIFEDAIVTYPTLEPGSSGFNLGPLTMSIPANRLTIINGQSGAGKSTILSAIIRQCQVEQGKLLKQRGTLALCTQSPWIMSGTVRDNITFLRPFERDRYAETIRLCCLESDIGSFPGGDFAMLGESGANLSGGQRARISLARAVYSEADILLLDDCLAAVDSKIANKIFHDCIRKLRQTVILVSHQTEYIPHSDYLIRLENGVVAEEGYVQSPKSNHRGIISRDLVDESGKVDASSFSDAFNESQQIALPEEQRARGSVDYKLYRFYFECMGGFHQIAVLLTVFVLTVAIRAINSFWLPWWMRDAFSVSKQAYMAGYILVVALQGLFIALIGIFLVIGTIKASRRIHDGALTRLFKAPLAFFHVQPLGQILNRLSVDIEGIDFRLINAGDLLFLAATSLLSTMIVLTWSSPYLLIPFIPIVYFQYQIQSLYRVSARELRRVCSLLDSPVLSIISESLSSIPTVKAYNATEMFESRHRTVLSRAITGITVRYALETWLMMRVEMLSIALLGFAGFMGIAGLLDTMQAGLVFTMSISMSKQIHQFLWSLINFEVEMNSVERLHHYMSSIPGEEEERLKRTPSLHRLSAISTADSHQNDPISTEGIIYSNVTVQHQQSHSPALKNFSTQFRPKEKVGIVGRSGSGKSTIIAALSALVPVVNGNIMIDGTQIDDMPIATLRGMVHVLPQEPVLFSGSLRQNLDPQSSHSHAALIDALSMVGALKAFDVQDPGDRTPMLSKIDTQSQKKLLDMLISSGGTNISAGQGQLVCLARALLAKPKIIVMDEATASLDMEMENMIQKVLQNHFRESTVICVAHRPTSVAWMDRILVIADGQCVKEGSGQILGHA